jgi:hypothetical protein
MAHSTCLLTFIYSTLNDGASHSEHQMTNKSLILKEAEGSGDGLI